MTDPKSGLNMLYFPKCKMRDFGAFGLFLTTCLQPSLQPSMPYSYF